MDEKTARRRWYAQHELLILWRNIPLCEIEWLRSPFFAMYKSAAATAAGALCVVTGSMTRGMLKEPSGLASTR